MNKSTETAIMMNNQIKDHYASPGLRDRIVKALESIGKSPSSVHLDDLAALDEFHVRGPAATRELIEILEVGAHSHVLDVGSGLGGPARRLAKATGCRVTGIDLSEDYCAVGNELTDWLGLSERVRLEARDATQLGSFAPSPFDAAWSIHVSMNVEDKSSLYASVADVLKPGAPFILFDLLSTGAEDPQYPAPWAATPEQSFLATADEMSAHLERAGFSIIETNDQTPQALAFVDETIAKMKNLAGPPPLGLQLVLGPAFKEIIAGLRLNLASPPPSSTPAKTEPRCSELNQV
jgi:ubiquinone/menaquinone biosynthesis C-methylase UbiE